MHRVTPLTRDWEGQTVVFIGNGTSVEELDLSVLKRPGVKVIVTNGGWRTYPDADVLMCSDRHWLAANSHDWSGFTGKEIITTQPQAVVTWDKRIRVMGRQYIDRVRPTMFFYDPAILTEGHTSTTTCLSVAVLRGAKRIIILGVDLAPSKGMRRRAGEEERDNTGWRARYGKHAQWITKQAAAILKRGIEVFNCSPPSMLQCYPYRKLEDVLPHE